MSSAERNSNSMMDPVHEMNELLSSLAAQKDSVLNQKPIVIVNLEKLKKLVTDHNDSFLTRLIDDPIFEIQVNYLRRHIGNSISALTPEQTQWFLNLNDLLDRYKDVKNQISISRSVEESIGKEKQRLEKEVQDINAELNNLEFFLLAARQNLDVYQENIEKIDRQIQGLSTKRNKKQEDVWKIRSVEDRCKNREEYLCRQSLLLKEADESIKEKLLKLREEKQRLEASQVEFDRSFHTLLVTNMPQ